MQYKNRTFLSFALTIGILLTAATVTPAQHSQDGSVDSATRTAVIDNLIKELNDGYVFPDVARSIESHLRKRQSEGAYDPVTSSQLFAQRLTEDVQSISKDKHLRVRFYAQPLPLRTEQGEPTEAEREQGRAYARRINFGFEKIERLNGNIGYIDLRGFSDHVAGAETVAAAMTFLANTDALIFDLRQNGGGSPFMVALISSYLFGDKPVHLNSLYWRKGDRTDDFWTKPEAAARKFPNKDVYILTSNRTFSAAEEFTYNLKNLKRATVIGETTGGGAHPGGLERLSDHFGAFIPTGRAISPITKTNWEGTGVEPDIKAPKEQALKIAYMTALKKSLDLMKDEMLKGPVRGMIDQLQKELDEMRSNRQ